MDKLTRFIGVFVPNTLCNLRCGYCYLQHCNKKKHKFPTFKYTPEQFRAMMSKERLGGCCLFNFTADGETLLDPQMVGYIRAILDEGHYVEIITNATATFAMEQIAKFPKELLERLMFKCSFHYLELKKRNWFDRFWSNVRLVRDAGASFTVELMPHDEIIPYRKEIYEMCVHEIGAPCHLTVGRDASKPNEYSFLTNLSKEEYFETWKMFDSKMFEFKFSVFEKRRCEFCYAGEWMMPFYMESWRFTQCYRSWRSIDGRSDKLKFKAIGHFCRQPHCFNAHAWMTLGVLPAVATPCYAEMRNRICRDGSEWLRPRFKEFISQQFKDNNHQYSLVKRFEVDMEMLLRKVKASILARRIVR